MGNLIEKIMVYIDGSDRSWLAAQYAVLLARSTGAELYGIYIINTQAISDLVNARIFVQSEQEEYLDELEKDSGKYLTNLEKMGTEYGVKVNTLKESGAAASIIKKMTREFDIDLLIVGELPQVRSRRDEMRDEVERAIRAVKCSVLIVKDEERVMELLEDES